MSTHPNTPSLHPALWVAAASITAVSLAGVAKLTGLLPDFGFHVLSAHARSSLPNPD